MGLLVETLIETARVMAALKWPVDAETRIIFFPLSEKPPQPKGDFSATEDAVEWNHFITPGGVPFRMGYSTKFDELVIVTYPQ